MTKGLASRFFRIAAQRSDCRAIACGGETMTYGGLAARVARLSHALADRGVAKGDGMAILAPNSIDYVALMLAAADLGVTLTPLSPTLPIEAVARAFESGDVKHVAATAQVLALLRRAGKAPSGACVIPDEPSSHESAEAWISHAPTNARPQGNDAPDLPFILTMTSGSTGDPKPIVLTQGAKIARAAAAAELYGVTQSDRILAATPLYHSLAERLVLTPLLVGAQSVLMERYSPSLWLETVRADGVTMTIAVSSQLAGIARHLEQHPAHARLCLGLRCVVSSSAPLELADKARILKALPGEFHECYGASEVAIATSLCLTAGDAPAGSVGRAAPGVSIRILSESGDALPAGEIGEIAVASTMMFSGYRNRPDLTASAMADGYFRTGDLGRMDEAGALWFMGRSKDLIITGGVNVYPTDVEAVVSQLPGVRACAAFAMPDDRLGEEVSVAIVAADYAKLSPRAIRAWCLDRLADYQMPRRIMFVDALPMNDMGKVIRSRLPVIAAQRADVRPEAAA